MAWQMLLRRWLQREAAGHVREAVQGALHEAASDTGAAAAEQPAGGDTRPPPCHAAIVFALREEAGGLLDRLTGVVAIQGHRFTAYEGALGGKLVTIALSGPGSEAAAHATAAVIAGHRPAWVISAGFAGALTDGVPRGGLVVANEVIDAAGQRLAIDVRFDADWLRTHGEVQVGRLLSVAHVIGQPEEKRRLGEQHAALAVDMESLAVAQVCRREQARCLVVRAISDGVDEALPAEVRKLLKQKTLAGKLGAVTGAVFRRPSSAKDWWRLRENALLASDKLGRFLEEIIAQLPDASAKRR